MEGMSSSHQTPKTFSKPMPDWIQQLLTSPSRSQDVNKYVQFLHHHKQIKYLSLSKFTQYVYKHLGQYASRCLQLIQVSDEKQRGKKNITFTYPIIINQKQSFSKEKLKVFVDYYEIEEQQIHLKQSVWDEPQTPQEKIFKQFKISKGKKVQVNEQQNLLQQNIPIFLRHDHSESLLHLLILDLTQYFSIEIDQIKSILMLQIQRQQVLLNTYSEYISQYRQLYYIREGYCDPKDQVADIRQIVQKEQYTIRQFNPLEHNHHLKPEIIVIWEQVHMNLQQKLKELQPITKDQIKNILKHGLDTVSIIFLGTSRKLYGFTNNQKIFVNINRLCGNLSIQQFKQPLKAYVMITIYHELAHYLIRSLSEFKLQSNSSFEKNSSSIGASIIQFVKKLYPDVLLELGATKNKNTQDGSLYINQLRDLTNKILDIFQRYKLWIKLFQDNAEKFSKLKENISVIGSVLSQSTQVDANFISQDLDSVYSYIQKLSNEFFDQNIKNSQSQKQYQFFFSLFMEEEIFGKWLKNLHLDLNHYNQFRQKLKNAQINKYFLGQNHFINKLVNQFVRRPIQLSDIILRQQKSIKDTTNSLVQLCNNLNNESANQMYLQLTSLQYYTRNLFNNLLEVQKLQNTEKLFDMSSFRTVMRVLEIVQYYSYFKNILKWANMIQIICQLRLFRTVGVKDLESGYIIERMLFPNLRYSNIIYQKDYKLIKTIFSKECRQKVGIKPSNKTQQRLSINASRSGMKQGNQEPFIVRGYCGHEKNNKQINHK